MFEGNTWSEISHHNALFSKCFRPTRNDKPAFPNSSNLIGDFEKLPSRDGLVRTVGLTIEMKLQSFHIFPAVCGCCLNYIVHLEYIK